ncbi:MAG TPA: hypothetical protein VGC42_16600 [Kofleriaceae bacterium]
MVEAIGFLEGLVRALGRGWSARFNMIAPYGVYGVTLLSDVGGSVEIVPALVRGPAVIWSPFVFTRGEPHYELWSGDRLLLRTPTLDDAVARLERWRAARGPGSKVAARFARLGRGRRTTEVDLPPGDTLTDLRTLPVAAVDAEAKARPKAKSKARPRTAKPPESLVDVLRDARPGELERARKLAKRLGHDDAARQLFALASAGTGVARANALAVLATIAAPIDGVAIATYLGDPDRAVQRAAVDGLARARHVAAIPALAALVIARDGRPTSGRTQLAAAAAAALKALSGLRGGAGLLGYFTAVDPVIREAACVAIGLTAAPAAKQLRPLLERLVTDAEPRVARAARRALASL